MKLGTIRPAHPATLRKERSTQSSIRQVPTCAFGLPGRSYLYTLSRTSSFAAVPLFVPLGHQIVGSGVVGMAAIYFMVNPSKLAIRWRSQ
jgi:hypothetical protein